ncbi:hypothetical protein NW768_001464 [Fusarium equiseti]|uniref:Uncharacterized protein n=1 Tax=Fusarium equiseti TaxID=61235 RepID=A0ABQ8RQM6_FUSEQ|nr:hypothetical protein NW768_001464 [Fusarium equiseti]
MSAWPETDLEKMTKGWSKAMEFSKARLQRVHDLAEDQLDDAIKAGHLVLENREVERQLINPMALPLDFGKSSIPKAYHGHIMMYGGSRTKYPPRCPFEFMQEPPPVYQKETPKIES